jgi:hypothetical protein
MVKNHSFRWSEVDKVMIPLTIAVVILWALVKFV